MRRPKRPIEDCNFSEVISRVTLRLAQLEYRREATDNLYQFSTNLLHLSNDLRDGGFSVFKWPLVSLAKHIAWGGHSSTWPSAWCGLPAGRARHKQRTH